MSRLSNGPDRSLATWRVSVLWKLRRTMKPVAMMTDDEITSQIEGLRSVDGNVAPMVYGAGLRTILDRIRELRDEQERRARMNTT